MKSNYSPFGFTKAIAICCAVLALLMFSTYLPTKEKEAPPLGPAAAGLMLFQDECEVELRQMAKETSIPWRDGSADAACFCLAYEYLLRGSDYKEEEVLEAAKAMTSNKEVFRGLLLYEKVGPRCND